MFIENKYKRWHDAIINRAFSRPSPQEYTEKHHILPSCMGGPNDPDNLVRLSLREHFLIHWLLIKFVSKGKALSSLKRAFAMMGNTRGTLRSSWRYARAKSAHRNTRFSPETLLRLSVSAKKRCTPEWRANKSALYKGKKRNPEHVAVGWKHTPEAKAKISVTHKGPRPWQRGRVPWNKGKRKTGPDNAPIGE